MSVNQSPSKNLNNTSGSLTRTSFVNGSKSRSLGQLKFAGDEEDEETLKDKRYRELRSQLAFNSEVEGYIYNEEIGPAAILFNILGSDASVPKNEKLKLWLPDTLIYKKGSDPIWVYSDTNGNVVKTNKFRPHHVTSKLGDPDAEDDIVVIKKTQILRPAKTDSRFLLSEGNDAELLTTRTLTETLNVIQHNEYPVVLQRYIRSKGNSSNITRVLWGENQTTKAWAIISKFTYDDESVAEIDRFTTNYVEDNHCTIYPIQGKFCQELSEIMLVMVKYLSNAVGRPFVEVIADFIRDKDDQWWFLQVKAFRIKDGVPTLSGMEMIRSETSLLLMDKSGVLKQKRIEAEALQLPEDKTKEVVISDGEDEEETQKGDSNSRRYTTCACCGVGYQSFQLPYKMTYNMVKELKTNIKIRCGNKDDAWTSVSAHLAKKGEKLRLSDMAFLYQPLCVCTLCYKVYRAEQKLRAVSSALARAMGVPAPAFQEANNKDGSKLPKLSDDPGAELVSDIPPASLPDLAHSVHVLPKNLTMCRVLILLHALHDVPVSAVVPPDNYRPSNSRQSYISTRTKASQRLVIQIKMFQQVINLPIDSNVARRVMYKDPKKSDKKKFDRKSIVRANKTTMNENKMNDDDDEDYNNNNQDEEEVDYSPNTETPIADESVRNVEQDEQLEDIIQSDYDENKMNDEDDNEQKQNEEEHEEEDLVIIPLNYMRVFYFLITNTKMTGQVQSGSGLGKVIEDETGQYMTISLRYEGSDFPLSTAKLPLSQFKCDYVSTVDDFMPLTIGGDTAELQMTIGLERAKDNLDMTHMKDRLYQFNDSIYVPPENYFSCDPVPEDWLAKLPHAGLTALDKKCSMGIWKDTNLEVIPMLEQEKSITNNHETPQESAFAARTIKPVDYNDERNDPVTRQYQTPSPTSQQQQQQQQQSPPPPLLGLQQPVKVNGAIQPLKFQSLKSESTPTIKLSARTYLTSPHDSSGPTLSKREVMEFDDQKQGEQKETDLRKLTVKHSQNLLSQAVNIPPPLSTALKIRTPTGGSNKNSPVNALRIEQDIIPRTPRIEEMKKEQTEKAIRRESWPNSVWCMTVEFHTIFNVAHPVPGSKPYYPPPKKIDNRRYMRLDGGEDFEDVGVRRRSSITGITPDCKIACQARYYICGVPFTVDGFIVDPESNEATFQTTFKHYIKGSIESIGSFFKQTKAFVVEIYSPTLPQAGIYSTEVDWSCLAENGTYDVFGEGQLPPRPMPGLHYPPYFTLSSYIYRMGPVRRDEALPHGFMPAAQCGQVQLLKCVKDQ